MAPALSPAPARPLRRGGAVLALLVAAALPPAWAAATPRAFSPQEEQALSGHWLVILGSKRDPAEAIPGLDTLAAHPEAGITPRTLVSSRFKNLMPCYTVTVAAAPAE